MASNLIFRRGWPWTSNPPASPKYVCILLPKFTWCWWSGGQTQGSMRMREMLYQVNHWAFLLQWWWLYTCIYTLSMYVYLDIILCHHLIISPPPPYWTGWFREPETAHSGYVCWTLQSLPYLNITVGSLRQSVCSYAAPPWVFTARQTLCQITDCQTFWSEKPLYSEKSLRLLKSFCVFEC